MRQLFHLRVCKKPACSGKGQGIDITMIISFTQNSPRDIHDQTLKASDGLLLVDGKKKMGTMLQRCLDIAKNKVRTTAGDAYGTVCTK